MDELNIFLKIGKPVILDDVSTKTFDQSDLILNTSVFVPEFCRMSSHIIVQQVFSNTVVCNREYVTWIVHNLDDKLWK